MFVPARFFDTDHLSDSEKIALFSPDCLAQETITIGRASVLGEDTFALYNLLDTGYNASFTLDEYFTESGAALAQDEDQEIIKFKKRSSAKALYYAGLQSFMDKKERIIESEKIFRYYRVLTTLETQFENIEQTNSEDYIALLIHDYGPITRYFQVNSDGFIADHVVRASKKGLSEDFVSQMLFYKYAHFDQPKFFGLEGKNVDRNVHIYGIPENEETLELLKMEDVRPLGL